MRRLTLTIFATIALVLTACLPGEDVGAATTSSSPIRNDNSSFQGDVSLEAASLQPAGSCEELLTAYQERALEIVGPYGIGGGDFWIAGGVEETMAAAENAEGDSGGASGYQTNVQVEGVDEADMIKSDGRFIYDIMNGSTMRIWERTDDGLEARGRFRLDRESNSNQLLLSGDTLVIIASRWQAPTRTADTRRGDDVAYPEMGSQFAELIELDISDPSQPEERGRLVMDGSIVSTRLVDNQLRVVLQSGPVGVEWAFPEGSGLRAERAATERNREIVRETTIDNWLPYSIAIGPDGEEEGVMLDCEDVLVPGENNGVDTLSIVEFDVGNGLESWTGGGVIANGETVYATPDRVYVGTGPWQDPNLAEDDGETRDTTSIHRFDTPADGDPRYVASGAVPGYLLNQFAMDEHNGDLRVASTETPAWWGEGGDSQSYVTVLRTEGDELTEIGSIDGLGVTEQIYAVRFMGDMGYVVTFRQVDPLYTIDLSDPTSPEMMGELKITGYSAYLHPLDGDRLLGVGQNATEEGMTTGLQASLFDVSDPSDPTRLDTAGVRDAYSPIEFDHHAFTTDGDTGYVPYETWSWNEEDETESVAFGVLAIPLTGDDLSDTRKLIVAKGKADGSGDPWRFSPQRTLVFDDTLYAFGHGGITEIDLTTGEVTDQMRR